MKFNVLVFPCGSEIGLEVNRSLKWSSHVNLYGASSMDSNHGKFVYKNYIGGMPSIEDSSFIDELNKIIDKYQIDFFFPAHDSVVEKASRLQSSINCRVITSPSETCTICRSKKKTYQLFDNIILSPKVYGLDSRDLIFPIFLKPEVGQGSKGTHIANSRDDINFYLNKDSSLLVLEYLPGEELTVDCFTDRFGILRFVGARKRERINNGISVHSHPVYDKDCANFANIINNTLAFRGAWFFQLKRNSHGKLTLLEIAPRIAGTMCLYRNLGINFPLLSIFDAANMDVIVDCNVFPLEVDRALYNKFKVGCHYKDVYVDFDDCLLINGNINISLISFLYQCINKGIKIHLLTKHSGDLSSLLIKYKLKDLFDSITQLDPSKSKYEYIKCTDSIFIDDSFQERYEIRSKLNIPVFAPDALECLID